MSKGRRALSEEEQALWRRATEDVARRHRSHPHFLEPHPPLAPNPAFTHARPFSQNHQVSAPLTNRANEKRIRRGKVEIGASLDLHGCTYLGGRDVLQRFLERAHEREERTVLVVTGIGRGGEGVLRRALPGWLAEPALRTLVAGYATAHRAHGGPGAFYVFLRRRVSSR
ncbi:MAG: Smr/MutS family protein [Hyphomonadaceae bacterium]|nr:Smr/MutS family protein [Hyphomonadaceae bacterium]